MARIVIANKAKNVELHIRMEEYKDQGWVVIQFYTNRSMVASIEVQEARSLIASFNDPNKWHKSGYLSVSVLGKGRMMFLDYDDRKELTMEMWYF